MSLPNAPDARAKNTSNVTQNDLGQRFVGVAFGHGVQILGLRNVEVGEGTVIGDDAWVNVCIRDENIRLRIGRNVLIGRQCMVSTAGHLEIGDYCVLAPRVYVSDADHTYADISAPILQQPPTCGRSLIVEENCWLGIHVAICGNLTVGRGSVVGANAVVTTDVPPFSVVAGVPAKVIKMYNPATQRWQTVAGDAERTQILEVRQHHGIPGRQEYRRILAEHACFSRVDPILAGRGQSI
ncbi:MAG: acyltransferase [Kiritimatiellae bacterium]|nr:acyltransferase [Kiritimatiellia bacterium]